MLHVLSVEKLLFIYLMPAYTFTASSCKDGEAADDSTTALNAFG
jgi:hypothetical protein